MIAILNISEHCQCDSYLHGCSDSVYMHVIFIRELDTLLHLSMLVLPLHAHLVGCQCPGSSPPAWWRAAATEPDLPSWCPPCSLLLSVEVQAVVLLELNDFSTI